MPVPNAERVRRPTPAEAATVPHMPATDAVPATPPVGASLGDVLTEMGPLLSSFGVVPTQQRDEVEAAITRELQARGHQAELTSLRYGVARLDTTVQGARFLRYDLRNILLALEGSVPGKVQRITVRVTR